MTSAWFPIPSDAPTRCLFRLLRTNPVAPMPLLPLLCTGGNLQTKRIRWTRQGDAAQAAGEAAKVYAWGDWND
jgi:hypothetical protein